MTDAIQIHVFLYL